MSECFRSHSLIDVSVYPGDDTDPESDLTTIKLEINSAQAECSRSGLGQIAKWLTETKLPLGPENLHQPELSRGK